MTPEEYEVEFIRLHAFAMQLAERLAAASEVLAKLAERKEKRAVQPPSRTTFEWDPERTS